MKSIINHSIPALMLSTTLAGCSTVYVEQETPAGYVVPPIPQVQQKPLTTSLIDSGTMERETLPSQASSYSHPSAIDVSFQEAYIKANKPRIALYLYRQLSQDVRDYQSSQRLAFSGDSKKDGPDKLVIAKQNDYNVDKGARYLTKTDWAWSFENQLMTDFINEGVDLVDRATVMRILAANVDEAKDSTGMLSGKKIEVDALKGYADVYVEILALPSKDYQRRYDYQAVVKRIDNGQIMASATTLGHDTEDFTAYGGGSVGNISDNITPIPTKNQNSEKAENVARWLGWEIRNKLRAYWSR